MIIYYIKERFVLVYVLKKLNNSMCFSIEKVVE